ncbi:TonB-dependent receptor [Caulobacter mirabilis]|uniref:TonB-dependent receptor n=1 Tax=Caulobacter mirabilis TaxID=69666 RepID=A0A2D2AZ89_9CAUL|nr:TonB-dependent receptor [Caulobacter mirabilis]ATQ43328.1 TonB-dependent receptor [Caulobacter mirabilis]
MKRYLLSAAAGALLVGTSSVALAEEAPSEVDAVVVTAQKREQAAQDVGVALTVLSGDDLAQRGVATVNQLQNSVPSLEITPQFGSGNPGFRLRGVGFDDYASNNTATVGVYVDEVAYPIQAQTQGLLFDIARVEVLRGPQGTLYGRNTTGGAINFVTNAPTRERRAGATAQFDSHDGFKAEGYVAGPISDALRFRVAGVVDQGGAWQKNRATGESLGDRDIVALRGQLVWEATDKLDVTLSAHGGYDRSEPNGLYLFGPLTYNGALPAVPADRDRTHTGWGGSSAFAQLTGIGVGQKPFRDNESWGVGLKANYDFDVATLTSITSYETLRRREFNDWDASQHAYAGTYFDTDAKVFSQEVRLASNGEGRLHWLVGAYYSHEKLDEAFYSDFFQSLGFDTATTYEQKARSASVFGQLEYALTDKLTLIAGLRGEDEKREQGDYVTAGVTAPGAPPVDFSPPADKSLKNRSVSGKLGLEYRPSDDLLVYASLSKGTKSGGFTAYNVPNASAVGAFKPETLWAYELGFKSEFADGTVQLNGAVFYYDYRDQQVQSAIWNPLTGPIGAIVNAQKSHIYGGELELNWRPLPGLRISQSLGYKTGEFDEYNNDLDIAASVAANAPRYINRSGAKVGFAPLSYGGQVAYSWSVGGFEVEAETNYAFHDEVKPLLLGPRYNVDSYWIANASITLSPAKGPWSVSLFARNLLDEKYDLTRNFFLPGIDIAASGEPRVWGVRGSLKY